MEMDIVWIGIGILALVLEILTPTALVSIWITIGALAAWLCAALGLSWMVQASVCVIVSVLFIVVVRPYAVKYLRGNTVPTNADRIIGETAIVVKEINEQHWGEVKVQGMVWSAVSRSHEVIEIGKKVRIIAIEGAKLLVSPLYD